MTNAAFNWVHLSDLHFGLGGQTPLWPSVREAFFGDFVATLEIVGGRRVGVLGLNTD